MASSPIETGCCIAGGGPAGMMLGYLLARRGVRVTVLERHPDFFRDFRGDTVHPSTLEVLGELGLLAEFLRLPHQRIESVGITIGDATFTVADFRHLPVRSKFVVLMPQWDFLDFLAGQARRLPGFQLLMNHAVVELTEDGGRITGVRAAGAGGEVEVRAELVVGCDGRHSVVRQAAGLELIDHGVPVDVLWFRLSRREGDPAQVLGQVNYGRALILINRSEYFQAGLIIPKGSLGELQAGGIERFRATLGLIAPWLSDRVGELRDWDQVKALSVQINRLRRWHRPGLLCIGDAAHAMSPAGGVGINLAIQDSVAAANLLAGPLLEGRLSDRDLAAVERRRRPPTVVIQAVQLAAHRGFARVFRETGPMRAPWPLHAVQAVPGIQRVAGYAVGIGPRPEHVRDAPGGAPSGRLARAVGIAAAAAVSGFVLWKICSAVAGRGPRPA